MSRVIETCSQVGRRWLRPLQPVLARPRLDQGDIRRAFDDLHPGPQRIVLVHSSLSACGFIKGGALPVIDALREWIGEATLAMPTHTYCYPNSDGDCEVYDGSQTSSRVGALTEAFWRRPGVLRSQHPTHSLACEGLGAEELIAGHDMCKTPCGKNTPYQKLVENDASVLMFGVSLSAYTLFHTAEDDAEVPYLYESKPYVLKLRAANGEVSELRMRRQDMSIARRFGEIASWLEARGLLLRRRLGKGELLWIPSATVVHHEITAELRRNPWFLVAR